MSLDLSDPTETLREGPYSAPNCEVTGPARSVLFHVEGYSLWQVVASLEKDASISWGSAHGDEVVYVLEGALNHEDQRVDAGSAIVLEAGVAAALAVPDRARVIHFGPSAIAPPTDGLLGAAATGERGVHRIAGGEAAAIDSEDHSAVFFADGSCPTCRAVLLLIDGTRADRGATTPSHVHSNDEIIHVLEGELQVGRLRVGPGTSIAIPGGTRYGFRTSGPFRFLNYRADVSTFVGVPGSEPILETVASWTARRDSVHVVD